MRFCSEEAISVPMCDHTTACNLHRQHMAKVEHHKEGASGYTLSCTACITPPQIDYVPGQSLT